ncbi:MULTISPECIES: class I SAM-dependent methyltransferase [Protofrankia]|uniref:Methyltransferase type 11 n=1 Tax=Protofrankia coriariae TaxID=1562887 RepID=A0ABR5F4U2_9ACTN|nr:MULTISPECIES: methyltransferase domain-containing protein [Protofrankia]KLL11740.1 methyltransferase type 11 [Protofrankia coriariae]ONH38350.1 methyltransferase type 11 [Protofrankia sp. BMG5.30]
MLPRLDAEPDQPRGRTPTLVYEAPTDSDDPYWAFYEDVAATQLASWLPMPRIRVLDVSGPRTRFARQMVTAGHDVVRVVPAPDRLGARGVGRRADGHARFGGASLRLGEAGGPATVRLGDITGPGRLVQVAGDPRSLDWFAPESFDAVLAEGRALSFCLATETTLEEIHRMLRPGGRLLLCVDSLLLGLARLAEQHRWAELSDVPRADVVLVPAEDGSITRCFWPEELRALLTSAGLDVDWIRPRTVLSAEAVTRAVASDVSCFPTLVRTEVDLSAEREGESIGIHLVASARRPD